MKKIIVITIISLTLYSCSIFLQKTGMKDYSLKEKINSKGLNEFQYDFIYLSKVLEEGFPQIDSVFPKREREEQKNKIIQNLATGNQENADFILQSRKYLSHLKNQHTAIYLKSEFKNVYPFIIHISSNHWYLLNIGKEQDSLNIGKRINKINELSTDEIEKRLADFTFAENKINQQSEIRNTQLYNKPQYLKEINVIGKLSDSLKITFEDESSIYISPISTNKRINVYQIHIQNNEITKVQNKTYFYEMYPDQNFGYLQFNNCHDKIDILDGIESYVKPWLQPIARAYAKHQFKKEKPSKLTAPYYNPKYPVFKDFVWELVDSLNKNNIKNLVIDLRNNSGGSLTLGIQLMYFLTDKDDLKGFSEYAYTSDIYKNYFPDEYENLMKNNPSGIPEKKIIIKEKSRTLFYNIADSTSKYYIPKERPVFKGDIYILSNYGTGSAAAMLTTLFQDNGIGTVIGTSVGNNPIGATTYTPMKLPKTKANISIATTYLVRPNKLKGKYQIPDYWVEYSLNDLMTGSDSYLELVKSLIKNNNR